MAHPHAPIVALYATAKATCVLVLRRGAFRVSQNVPECLTFGASPTRCAPGSQPEDQAGGQAVEQQDVNHIEHERPKNAKGN